MLTTKSLHWVVSLSIAATLIISANGSKAYCAKIFINQGAGMAPFIFPGDEVELETRFHQIKRGDVIAEDNGGHPLFKRVIGLPGDQVAIVNGRITLNGKSVSDTPLDKAFVQEMTQKIPRLADPHKQIEMLRESLDGHEYVVTWDHSYYGSMDAPPVTLQKDQYFVLNDMRELVSDSRVKRPTDIGLIGGVVIHIDHHPPGYLTAKESPQCIAHLDSGTKLDLNHLDAKTEDLLSFLQLSPTAAPIIRRFEEALSTGKVQIKELDPKTRSMIHAAIPFSTGEPGGAYSPCQRTLYLSSEPVGSVAATLSHELMHWTDSSFNDFAIHRCKSNAQTQPSSQASKTNEKTMSNSDKAYNQAVFDSERKAYDQSYLILTELEKKVPCYRPYLKWNEIHTNLWVYPPSDSFIQLNYFR